MPNNEAGGAASRSASFRWQDSQPKQHSPPPLSPSSPPSHNRVQRQRECEGGRDLKLRPRSRQPISIQYRKSRWWWRWRGGGGTARAEQGHRRGGEEEEEEEEEERDKVDQIISSRLNAGNARQRQNWSQFTGSVTFGAFRVFAAGGPNWQNDCDKRRVFTASVK
ncbi:Hypothetical predicted protein [Scomber scombrus]|uniref:Uncharacterized protein n=1 Tax=Scomber scombrus TaxID=13677 RepID=A0AAV1NV56_SCOSC